MTETVRPPSPVEPDPFIAAAAAGGGAAVTRDAPARAYTPGPENSTQLIRPKPVAGPPVACLNVR